ncbi:dnaJ-like protein subfamily C member 2 [Gossypium australe]|uniref:DnaJ-like protein subfamily C member 2 n=1 Tax=Gossypium australe TaxID=47621 RepID=A0A5B6WSY4_9ROSI|nr:dnaJ-like protein subfamily C member 2 [Gossypium australe]
MVKTPMGMKNQMGELGRWEAIASAFKRKYKTDIMIKKAKELVDTRINDENEVVIKGNWNLVKDIALLNALKTCPKDVIVVAFFH